MAWEYTEKTKQLFLDAVQGKPGTHLGEIENPDGIGEHGSIACGDALRFTFRVRKHPEDPTKDVITEARYLTFGCTSAIAASEALCRLIEEGGYTPIEALKITNQDLINYLGGLPDQKIHCSVMGAEALQAAVFNWAQRRGVDLRKLGLDIRPEEQEEGRIVCKCFGVTEPYLRRKIKELGLKTIADITNALKAGGACMRCHHMPGGLQDILNEIWGYDPKKLPILPTLPGPAPVATTEPAGIGTSSLSNGALPSATSIDSLAAPVSASSGLPATTGLVTSAGAATTGGPPSGDGRGELSPYRFAKKVEQAIEQYVRPMLQKDGGDIELIDIKGHLIYCQLLGACAGCPGAGLTMKLMVEQVLKEQVDQRIRVIPV
ncbi:MAG: iron-sulfur cluster assembly scaffold protein [Thermoguttaceae bacterium]|nr:iron-sulfur cluster assembly scaffold protein [Thermoguttaceae bacterium]MDW8038487.1 iron-sulfur cluster assembly scaffold protein [Thermoguttaceae bacterium]